MTNKGDPWSGRVYRWSDFGVVYIITEPFNAGAGTDNEIRVDGLLIDPSRAGDGMVYSYLTRLLDEVYLRVV